MCQPCYYPDEGHLLHDLVVVIQPGLDGSEFGLRLNTLLFSNLAPTASFLLINASIGDEAVLASRDCGCGFEGMGWTRHIHSIRSFEKLTAAGMTFVDSHVVRVLEEVLPGRFGGGPISFQLVEEEAENGRGALSLVAHPDAGPLDETEVINTFLDAPGAPSTTDALMSDLWRQGGVVRVERRAPLTSQSGKIGHLVPAGHGRAPSTE
ncbi:MAG: hypothetical protein A3F84_25870 [Candidatus Handelsmanbacteria bacterium RIFCSPLOWO2_12_FULL_64_10]|uniref:Uncharacterized protein n=1 Tax=Handelsmanbacteria sp. (strain RIFCSPLOWO2_12_FULL_64_10) TaxID=1817868 RepID=A0A1F6CSU5_HANXR|nr:MAG: hypothetical protein A3F84_25870 [Candidatus Handelsmanbacteria bacterium RIFCSPLOWO2_12_FULL_64_10]